MTEKEAQKKPVKLKMEETEKLFGVKGTPVKSFAHAVWLFVCRKRSLR